MAAITTRPQVWLPPAAVPATVSHGTGGTWVNGSWVELTSATTAALALVALSYEGTPTAGTNAIDVYEVDIGIGASGSETVVATTRIWVCFTGSDGGDPVLHLPITCNKIPSGTRVAIRIRRAGSVAVASGFRFAVGAIDTVEAAGQTTTKAITSQPAAASVSVAGSGVAWSNSAWLELITALTEDSFLIGFATNLFNSTDQEYEFGVGAAGAEVPIAVHRVDVPAVGSTGFGGTVHHQAFPLPIFMVAGSRLAVRVRSTGTSVAGRNVGVIIVGAVATGAEVEFDTAETSIGLTWVEFLDKANVMRVSAKIELPDPSDYYFGFKEARVIQWGEIVRALSDRAGQYESAEFRWIWSDTDRVIRGLLDAESTRVFLNRPVTVRMIDDISRRALETPRTVWKGLVRGYKPLSPLHFEVTVNDILASKFSSENTKDQIPKRLLTRVDFADLPTDNINKPVPIIYGDLSSGTSATAAPVPTGTASKGAFQDQGYWGAGFGNLTSSAAVPTGVSASAAAGGTLSADVPNSEYGIIVTAVDASGNETDPTPFYYSGPNNGARGSFASGPITGISVDGTKKIQVSWAAAAGASKYRVYLGWYYYGVKWQQFIEVSAPTTSCEFTTNPNWSTPTTVGNITPGAQLIPFGQFWYYAFSAVCPDGETALSAEVFGFSGPYRRPIRLEWLAVTGATAYKVYRRGAGGTYDRVWTVPSSQLFFEDDLLDTGVSYINGANVVQGLVPTIWVGTRADAFGAIWYAFLICGHAVKEITDVFQYGVKVDSGNFGVTFMVPGKTGYGTYFPNTGTTQYIDINGNRYTMLFVRGPAGDDAAQGKAPITVTMKGIETVGDSSGTLITDLLLQYKHAVVNWMLQSYLSGAWLTTPVFPDDATLDQVDTASFDAASAVAAVRISGGYVGAFVIGSGGERVSLRDLVARFNVSADVDCGFSRKSQFFVSMFDDGIAALTNAIPQQDVNDINEASFDVDPRTNEVFNRIPYYYSKDYLGTRPKGWNYDTELSDATSISDLGETKSSPQIELHMVRNTTVASDVIGRRLTRSKEPSNLVKWQTTMAGLSIELGDIVSLTHFQGLAAAGWVGRAMRIVRHTVDPDKFTVSLEAVDVQRLFTGAFILGDTATLPASYTSGTTAQKRYGYLADETTKFFSNGDKGKRLR